jgi:hypothetical protein
MLKYALLLLLVFIANPASCQAPAGINYQGVARTATGTPLPNTKLALKLSIFDSTTSTSLDYAETQTVTTNALGLYNLIIGKGTPAYGTFASLDWSTGQKWIRVQIDPTGGTTYTLEGAMQLMSVPYALYASQTSTTNLQSQIEDAEGCVFVHRFCTGDGTIANPWKSSDSSAGIKQALAQLTPTKRILYFRPGYYMTQGALTIDFGKCLPNLSDPTWMNAFSGNGIEFQGHMASIYVNNGAPLRGGKPGILFNWPGPGTDCFYWKFNGLQFFGDVDTSVVEWGIGYDWPLNGFDFDIVANNGYVSPNYKTTMSPGRAIKINWPLESRLHLVAVSATGAGAELVTATFCTISGAFSNTIIPKTNTNYNNSYGLNLVNCQSNNFTHMDLEVAYSGIRFDQWSIQNTFSAIFVSQCDSTGATFDNSTQVTNGKNVVISIRSGPTVEAPSASIAQKLFTKTSTPANMIIQNYFDF